MNRNYLSTISAFKFKQKVQVQYILFSTQIRKQSGRMLQLAANVRHTLVHPCGDPAGLGQKAGANTAGAQLYHAVVRGQRAAANVDVGQAEKVCPERKFKWFLLS